MPEAASNNVAVSRFRKRKRGPVDAGTSTQDTTGEGHIIEAFTQLQVFQQKGVLCDLFLISQDGGTCRKLATHSCIMAASSMYLKAMLTGHLGARSGETLSRKQGVHEVQLPFDYATLSALVGFVYSGKLDICGESAGALLAAADFLRMEAAVSKCGHWLVQNMEADNVYLVRDLALEYRQTGVLDKVRGFMLEHFEQISMQPEFALLHATDLDNLLGDDELVVHTEADVYKALARWANADPAGRRDDYCRLFLRHIRLNFLSTKELQAVLADGGLAQQSLQVSQACQRAIAHAAGPARPGPAAAPPLSPSAMRSPHQTALSMASRSSLTSTSAARNRRWKIDQSIYIFGGRNQEQEHLKSVSYYVAHRDAWLPMEEMNTARAFLGVAPLHGMVYAVGGYNETDSFLNTVEYYNTHVRKWQYARSLSVPRASLGLSQLEDRLVAVGGENRASNNGPNHNPVYLSSVEVYHPATNMWHAAARMSTPRSFIGLGLVGSSSLYAIGGYDGEDYLETVERYDGQADVWSVMPSLNSPRSCCGVATHDGCLYVAGGYSTDHCLRSVEMYDPRTNVWRNVAPLEVERSYLSMIEFNGYLYAIGGLDSGENALDTVERYDPVMNRWTREAPFSSPVYACGLTVM